jgi:branched-chain amino acid transport system ATP-binding protein
VGLIGSNGAGKSTFLRAVSGLLKVREGEISFRGERIENLPPHEIVAKGVVQVPEGRQLFADMSIRDNLRLGAYLRRDTRAVTSDADNLTETFPVLRTRLNQRAGTASGGEQQILAIARALMAKPRLLLLDEPSMGLAPRIVKEVADIVREISRGYDVGIILVEQNATMALSVADRTYVMELGRIRITGSSAELRRDDRVRRAYLSE